MVLDVGANIGQYASRLIELGYRRDIISFEPMSVEYAILEERSLEWPAWRVVNCAIGDRDGEIDINIAGNSYSSSFLQMLPLHISGAPESEYSGIESVRMITLDECLATYCSDHHRVMLKLDIQGYERSLLAASVHFMNKIEILQIEMSLAELYEGETLFQEMREFLRERNFIMYDIVAGYRHSSTNELLQVDGLFIREKKLPVVSSASTLVE
ncbi:MAG: FkbM family methyltransferase [Bacteroidota bacterium]